MYAVNIHIKYKVNNQKVKYNDIIELRPFLICISIKLYSDRLVTKSLNKYE